MSRSKPRTELVDDPNVVERNLYEVSFVHDKPMGSNNTHLYRRNAKLMVASSDLMTACQGVLDRYPNPEIIAVHKRGADYLFLQ